MTTIVTRATKGSALTWTEGDANITNLNNDKIEDIVEDLTPQLGGNLDVNGNSIVSASNGNIAITPNGTGSIVLDGLNWPQADGTADYVLKTNGSGQLSWTAQSGGGSSTLDGLTDVVITAAATNDVLVYNGTNWVDTAANTLTVSAASTATTATNANNINISTTNGNSGDTVMYLPLVSTFATGNQTPHIDDGLFYDASTNTLSATTFSGNVSGANINGGAVGLAYGGTGKTTAPSALANLMGFTTTATAGGTTTLTSSSSHYQIFTGSTTQTITLPVVSTLANGWTFHICNNSTGNLTLNSSGGSLVITILPGTTAMATCINSAGGSGSASWESGLTDFSTATGTGSVVLGTSPTITGATLTTSAFNGTVGATTASTGAFTTLSATGAVTLSPANLAVAISPTGTGTVAISPAGALTINPTTASTINNTSIGATTASTGRFTTTTVTAANDLRLNNSANTFYVGFKAGTLSANKIWTLPTADGTANQVLKTDGAGVLGWATAGGGGPSIAWLSIDTPQGTLVSGTTYTVAISETADPSGIVTVSANTFDLAAGTYLFRIVGVLRSTGDHYIQLRRNTNTAATLDNFTNTIKYKNTSNVNTYDIRDFGFYYVNAATNTFEWRLVTPNTDTTVTGNAAWFEITKIA